MLSLLDHLAESRYRFSLCSFLVLFSLGTACDATSSRQGSMKTESMGGMVGGMHSSTLSMSDLGVSDAEVLVDHDLEDASLDLGIDPECGLEPACERGYRCICPSEEELECTCLAPTDRACTSDEDCRVGEQCIIREEEQLCWLSPETLLVESCPGDACSDQPLPSDPLWVGASSKSITPQGFETPTPEGLDGVHMNFAPPIDPMSGVWRDCGYDGLCPGDVGYVAPDRGEGDGMTQGAFIAGFSHGRPAQYCPEELLGCDRLECCISPLAHDDLLAQVLVIRRGDRTVAFVSLDLIGFFHSDIEKVKRALKADVNLDLDLLIVASTHTHESFDTVGQYGPGTVAPNRTGVDPRMITHVRAQVIEGVKEAIAQLKPAQAYASILDEGIDGLGVSDSRPPYIFDDNIPVVHFKDAQTGEGIATMLSIANHPEALWSENPYLSADYVHYVRKHIREGLPEVRDTEGAVLKPALPGLGGVVLQFVGSLGGLLNPGKGIARTYDGREISDKGFAKADAIGQRVAEIVLGAHAQGNLAPLTSGEAEAPDLRFASQKIMIPVTNATFLLAGFVLKLFSRDIYNTRHYGAVSFRPNQPLLMSEVAVVKLGHFTFMTAPGEAFSELLTGGYPGRGQAQNPTIGDVDALRVGWICDDQGLPAEGGDQPCVVSPQQDNPPPWDDAPQGPYLYDYAGSQPFFIGLGMDFLGYIVPEYDFEDGIVAGNHYEETNSASREMTTIWRQALQGLLENLP